MGRAHEVRAAAMAKTAAAKTKVYSKYGKEILIAAKSGVPDPEMNLALKHAIERAKKEQVPTDLIKRAIARAASGSAESYDSVTYEGYGPGDSTFIVECLTDNTNRTFSAVRSMFTKTGAKLGGPGSVTFGYEHVALVSTKDMNEEEVLDALVMAEVDAKNIETEDDEVTVTGDASASTIIKDALENAHPGVTFSFDEITWLPSAGYTKLSEEDLEKFKRLYGMLDENDDVQNVYHNVEL